MKCLAPIWIKYEKDSDIMRTGHRGHYVPCGKCEACVKNRQEDWFVRLKFQQKSSDFVWFVTLTYDDDHLPRRIEDGIEYNDVCKKDVQDYHKRLRQLLSDSSSFKYYLTSEYGGTFHRPHYHAIYYDIPPQELGFIEKAWQNGFIRVDQVNDARLKYVTGYITEKLFIPEGCEPVWNLMSKGLGSDYLAKYKDWHLQDTSRFYAPLDSHRAILPRYYKERIYPESVRKAHSTICDDQASRKVEDICTDIGFEEYHRLATSVRSDFIKKVANHRKNKKRNF